MYYFNAFVTYVAANFEFYGYDATQKHEKTNFPGSLLRLNQWKNFRFAPLFLWKYNTSGFMQAFFPIFKDTIKVECDVLYIYVFLNKKIFVYLEIQIISFAFVKIL